MRNTQAWTTARVRATRDITPTVRELELALDEEGRADIAWTPGSHIEVRVHVAQANGAARQETRSYSLVGTPEPGLRRIAVQRAASGRGGSAYMTALEVGARLAISGPKNLFELQRGAPQYLLVAGGIGITPIVGMALALRDAPVRLAYAARTRDELAYRDMLDNALRANLQTFVSAEGQRIDFDAEIAALHADAQMYLCGPMRLLDAARAAWKRAGRMPSRLRFETFGNSGRHAPETFWVRIPRHGVDIAVPPERSLLDALSDAGVEVLADCKRGECGLCTMEVLQVEGEIDHRDVFLAEHERSQRLCACVSRVVGGGVVLDSAYRPDA